MPDTISSIEVNEDTQLSLPINIPEPISAPEAICGSCYRPIDTDSECENCELGQCCCSCVECRSCDTSYARSDLCSNCINCESCCECSYCESCERQRNCRHFSCENCSNCSGCCTCDEEQEDERHDPVGYRGHWGEINNPKIFKSFPIKRLVGVEWEYNRVDNHDRMLRWAETWRCGLHEDGSCGMEAVTAPMRGSFIDTVLNDLDKSFRQAGVEVNSDCGIHVHVEAKDFEWHDVYKLLQVYSKVEPLLYLLGGQQRIHNTYCKPCGDIYREALSSPDPKEAILYIIYDGLENGYHGKDRHRRYASKKTDGRYYGLNLAPWTFGRKFRHQNGPNKDTTFEFRIHCETTDVQRVIGWTKLCVQLVDWCYKASDKEISSLPNSALRSLCDVIAPYSKEYIMKRIKDWREETHCNRYTRRYIKVLSGGKMKIERHACQRYSS